MSSAAPASVTSVVTQSASSSGTIFDISQITDPGTADTTTNTVIATDDATNPVLTSYTETVQETIVQPVTTFVTTHTEIIRVTDSAQYSSLKASASAATETTQSISSASKTSTTTTATTSVSGTASESSLSGAVIAGIIVAVVVLFCIASFLGFVLIRRRKQQRQRTSSPSDFDKEFPYGLTTKAELGDTVVTTSNTNREKPRLHSNTGTPPVELPTSQDTDLPHEGGPGAPTESSDEQEQQLREGERLDGYSTGFERNQTGEPSSPIAQNFSESTSRKQKTKNTDENLHSLKAQERELAHKMEASESLLRLRAEHAALLDRIRIAEMRERQIHGSA